MKKRNLAVLLALPFLISLLGVSVIPLTFNLMENDILSIGWDYEDSIGVRVGSKQTLKAYGINNKNYPVENVQFVWSVVNSDDSEDAHARIINNSEIEGLSKGEVKITCTNLKGNIYKSLKGIIYENGAVVINPKIKSSQSNVDPVIYYGEYDFDNSFNKIAASFEYTITTYGGRKENEVILLDKSINVSVDTTNKIINILNAGDAFVKFGFDVLDQEDSYTYSFNVVKDGVNVYDYDDLLMCTNKSSDGEIVVLRKHFESLDNYQNEDNKDNNVTLFGKYNSSSKKYSFNDEIYRFSTTYSNEFIKQWNMFVKTNSQYSEVSDFVNVGIRIQKDFYGNGYTLNLHNLTYAYTSKEYSGVLVPTLADDNLFRGPLPFYTLGDPNNMVFVGLYGQDNIGLYVDGNNINVNDVNLKNCDFGNNLANLEYVGTVLETHGDNISINDSRISCGKNVIRSFSSNNVTINNCLLSYSKNFLISVGSNEYIPVNDNSSNEFIDENANKIDSTVSDYLNKDSSGDKLLNDYIQGTYTSNSEQALLSIQNAMDAKNASSLKKKGSLDIKDSLFYTSGIASIGVETLFNGPFIYNSSPSYISELFTSVGGVSTSSLAPMFAKKIGGTSYPVDINIDGKTLFYDYKELSLIDLSGLINEHISEAFGSSGSNKISINDIFPLIKLLSNKVSSNGSLYNDSSKSYVNIPIAYYGGGKNLSKVTFSNNCSYKEHVSSDILINFLEEYLKDNYSRKDNESLGSSLKKMVLKCVTTVTGFNDFNFVTSKNDGYLFNETPKVETLINNKKGN